MYNGAVGARGAMMKETVKLLWGKEIMIVRRNVRTFGLGSHSTVARVLVTGIDVGFIL